MTASQPPTLGVIEAFYGRAWSTGDRHTVIAELGALGYQSYVYAPKSDRKLRAAWQQAWTDAELGQLQSLVDVGAVAGIEVGIGFAPLGLAGLGQRVDRDALAKKTAQLRELGESGLARLCILFDDMQQCGAAMARQQLQIVEFICERAAIPRVDVCPSYYSTDPVLERMFGPRPANYWRELGLGLDSSLGVFWTGEQVCSRHYSKENLDFIANEFRRLPSLWDNYPVNDGERMCQYLHLMPFAERYPWLQDYTVAHFANPMNQAMLSLLPLATLPAIYASVPDASSAAESSQASAASAGHPPALQSHLQAIWRQRIASAGEPLADMLLRDAQQFQTAGLNNFSNEQREQWAASYAALASPMACEVAEWLRGGYAFDPACLTD